MPMFAPEEDLPLFTGTPVSVKGATFAPDARSAAGAGAQTSFLADCAEISRDEARRMLRELYQTPVTRMDEQTLRLVVRLEQMVGA